MENKTENDLTFLIRKAIFEVQRNLGPGLLESVYEEALVVELKDMGLIVESQQELPVFYKGKRLKTTFRIDIIVENRIIIELKSVAKLEDIHYKQLLNYLRLKDLYVGLLVNFNSESINPDSFRRVYNKFASCAQSLNP